MQKHGSKSVREKQKVSELNIRIVTKKFLYTSSKNENYACSKNINIYIYIWIYKTQNTVNASDKLMLETRRKYQNNYAKTGVNVKC